MSADRKIRVRLYDVIEQDPQYSKEAYLFCLRAVRQTLQSRDRKGHVKGQDIVDTSYRVAHHEFGPMAKTVLQHWGIASPRCIGNIVFRLVENGILKKSDDDSIDDFAAHRSIDEIFNPEKEYMFKKRLKFQSKGWQ